ncbi:MAG: SPOCS domain-containing protein [Butyricicoccus sp.]
MELTKNTVTLSRLILDTWNNYEETTDAIVPDTFPDIVRIAAVYGSPQLKDDAPQSGRVLISGSVRMTVLYVPEGGGLRKLDIPISFAHIEEGAGINEDSQPFVSCRVVAADAHVMNSRKLSVTATLSISCRVFVPDSLCLTSGFAQHDGHLEQLTATHTVTVPAAVHRREFTLMDDVNLTDFSRYAAITAARGELRLSDCRLMNGKAVLKGDAALHLLVETTDGLLENTDCVVPFTQIFEVEGMTDNQQVCVSFSLRHLDAELRDDGLIGVGIGASVLLTAFETHTLQLVSDVYHLEHPVQAETRPVTVPSCHPLAELGCEASETIPVGMKIAQIADISAVLDTLNREPSRTVLRMMVCVVYRADDGEYYSIHRAVHMPLSLPDGTQGVRLNGMQCRAAATVSGEDSVVLSLSGRCSLLCDEPLQVNDLTALTIDETATSPASPVSVILRYVDTEERLWDIAKCYRTTVDAIRQANQLSTDHLSAQSQMLLIPVQ